MKKTPLAELRIKYPVLVECGRILLSYRYYIDDQLRKAERLDAPRNTIYFQGDEPVTTDTMKDLDLQKRLNNLC